MSGVPVWRRGRDLAHEMQTAGELAGLEGTISLWGTRHTGVSSAPFRERRRDRFREGKQRLAHGKRVALYPEVPSVNLAEFIKVKRPFTKF